MPVGGGDLERLEALFADAPVAIAVQAGPTHVYTLANRAYRRYFGGRDLTGKPVLEVLPPEASLPQLLDRVYASGVRYDAREFPFRVDLGHGFVDTAWIDFSCQPTRAPDGHVDGLVSFGVEVTSHVQARDKIEALAGELRQAVEARDEFLSIASHELKTPLTPFMLQVQLLLRELGEKTIDPVAVAQRAHALDRAVKRLSGLVSTLLDVSSLTGKRLQLALTRLDLSSLVLDVVQRAEAAIASSGSAVTVDAPAAVTGDWDQVRLEQIVTNLVGNALKYGRGRPIQISVSGAPGTATLRVADEGIGIAPADQLRIFERFERAVPLRHYGGFGLGLWIARQLVEALGGTIRVESELDRGSTFTVVLPRHS